MVQYACITTSIQSIKTIKYPILRSDFNSGDVSLSNVILYANFIEFHTIYVGNTNTLK